MKDCELSHYTTDASNFMLKSRHFNFLACKFPGIDTLDFYSLGVMQTNFHSLFESEKDFAVCYDKTTT